jgi:hypothetical protein
MVPVGPKRGSEAGAREFFNSLDPFCYSALVRPVQRQEDLYDPNKGAGRMSKPSLGLGPRGAPHHLDLVLLRCSLDPLHIERSLWRKGSRPCRIAESSTVEAFVLGAHSKRLPPPQVVTQVIEVTGYGHW